MPIPFLRRAATAVAVVSLAAGALLAVPVAASTAAAAVAHCPRPHADIIRSAPGAGKTVALTFDDGPSAFTPQILAVLRRYNVRATFFETGAHVHAHRALSAEVAAEGQLIADHTYDHYYPTQVPSGWSADYLDDQFRRTNTAIRAATGTEPCFFRPPGGFQTVGLVGLAAAQGMSTVLWSVDTEDWQQPGHTSAGFEARIVARAEAGIAQAHPILLMHDGKASHEPEWQVSSNRSNEAVALPAVLSFYQAHGYRFVDLLGRTGLPPAPTTLQLTGRAGHSVRAGTATVAVSGHLTAITGGVAGVRVRWYSRPAGITRWTLRGTVRTDRNGFVHVADRPVASTQYTLQFRGTGRFRSAAVRGLRTVRTYTEPTAVTVTAPTGVDDGSQVILTGWVMAGGQPRTHTVVSICRADGTGVSTVRVVTDSRGRFTYTDPAVTSPTLYDIAVPALVGYQAGHAQTLVTVHPADPAPTGTS